MTRKNKNEYKGKKTSSVVPNVKYCVKFSMSATVTFASASLRLEGNVSCTMFPVARVLHG